MTKNPFCVMLVKNILQAIPQTLREREFIFPKELDLHKLRDAQIEIHRKILDTVTNRDSGGARRAMTDHMNFERDLVLRIYPEKSDSE
jgi:DNA-binding GntR family transcriptional regulator